MKFLLRNYLINLGALWVTAQAFSFLAISEGFKGLLVAALGFMAVNLLLVPILKILLLPLNLLTLGIFAWLSNVLALYFLSMILPSFRLLPFDFPGADISGFIIPPLHLTTFYVAIVASFIIGSIIHIINWLVK